MIRFFCLLLVCFIALCQSQGQSLDGGIITLPNGDTSSIVCLTSDQSTIVDVILNGNAGENSAWVITSTEDSIIGLPLFPPFDLSVYDDIKIKVWHLSYRMVDGLVSGVHKDDVLGEYDYSNAICIEQKSIFSSTLSLVSEDTVFTCVGGIQTDSLVFSIDQITGTNNAIVAVDQDNEIIGIFEDTIVSIDSLRSGACIFHHITYEGIDGGLNIGDTLATLEGCFELSNGIAITKSLVDGGEIFLDDGRTDITICVGDGVADAFTPNLINDFGSESRWIITDSVGLMLAILSNNTFNLEGVGPGRCRIYHISYEPGVQNLDRLNMIDSLSGCYDLSNAIRINRLRGEAEGGDLMALSTTSFCNGDLQADSLMISLSSNVGDQSVYLIVDVNGVILDTFNSNAYDFEGFQKMDQCFVHGLSYVNGLDRLNVGANIANLEGCHDLSNPLSIDLSYVAAGEIHFPDDNDEITICAGDGVPDVIEPIIADTCSDQYRWILWQDDTIRAIQNLDILDVDIGVFDTVFVQLLAYNDIPNGLAVGSSINGLAGCYQLSNRLTILNSDSRISGGMLTTNDEYLRCNSSDFLDTIRWSIDEVVGDTSIYVLTNTNDQILLILQDTFIVTTSLNDQVYRVYHLSASSFFSSLNVGGTFQDIIGCFALSNSIEFEVRSINGGEITSDLEGGDICIIDGDRVPIAFDLSGNAGPLSTYIMVDADGRIDSILPFGSVFAEGSFRDSFFIYNITYYDGIANLIQGNNLNDLQGCFSLSNRLKFYVRNLIAPQLMYQDSSKIKKICYSTQDSAVFLTSNFLEGEQVLGVYSVNDSLLAILDSFTIVPSEYKSDSLYIRQYIALDSIVVDSSGDFSSSRCLLGSNTLEMIVQIPLAGQVTFLGDTSAFLCIKPGLDSTIRLDITGSRALFSQLVYTYASDTIVGLLDLTFNPNDLLEDSIRIYHLAYFDAIDTLTGKSINDTLGCLDISSPFTLYISRLSAGALSFDNGVDSATICIGSSDVDIIANNQSNQVSQYILTQADSTIIAVADSVRDLNLDTLGVGSYLIWQSVSVDSIENNGFDSILLKSEACIDISNRLVLNIESEVDESGFIQIDTIVYQCVEDIQKTICFNDIKDIEGLWLVLDDDQNIVSINDTSCFVVPNDRVYTVVKISYNAIPQNLSVGVNIGAIGGCVGRSNRLDIGPQFNDAGTISSDAGETEVTLCGIGFTEEAFYFEVNSVGFAQSFWIVTDTNDVIIDTFYQLPVVIDNNGPLDCRVYHMSYLPGIRFPQVDSTISILQGCIDLSNPISIEKSLLRGGNLMINSGSSIQLCAGDLVSDEINISIFNATGDNNAWVLTDTTGTISSILATPPNNFNGLPSGSCLLRHIRYTDEILGLDAGDNIQNVQGCYEFSDSIRIDKTSVNGGELTVKDSLRELNICVNDGIEEAIVPRLSERLGPDSLWMVTSAIGEILDISSRPPFNFEGQGEGQCFIWMVSFGDGVMGIEEGLFLADIEGCFAISNPIRVRKHIDDACVLSSDDPQLSRKFKVYPNPANEVLKVENPSRINGRITIYTSNFVEVKSFDMSQEVLIQLDISSLTQGYYFLSIQTMEGKETIGFFKF